MTSITYSIPYRYENAIAGQFFGHTHTESFVVFYDEIEKQRPVSMVPNFISFHLQSYFRILILLGLYLSISHNLLIP